MRRRTAHRAFAVAAIFTMATLPFPEAHATIPVLVVNGKGFGHGVGMAQDGALAMGKAGASTAQILQQFYPGTSLGKIPSLTKREIDVSIFDSGRTGEFSFPDGGEIRDSLSGTQSPGFPIHFLPGTKAVVRFDGMQYEVDSSDVKKPPTQTTAKGVAGASQHVTFSRVALAQEETSTTTVTTSSVSSSTTTSTEAPTTSTTTTSPATSPLPDTGSTLPLEGSTTTTSELAPSNSGYANSSSRSLWLVPSSGGSVEVSGTGHSYRGSIHVGASGTGLHGTNRVELETYLKGMGEVRNPKWPAASLRTQAIAARTYAARATSTGAEICDDTRCQVYLGSQAEYPAMNKAVNDTAGQVVVAGTGLASTVYSANGGGFEASREEGFGSASGGYTYLRAAPYKTDDPAPWTVKVALSDLAARLSYPGIISSVNVSRVGPSGRALEVVVGGTKGQKAVSGIAFAAGLGLRSTLFGLTIGVADSAPPPPAGAILQTLPDEIAANAVTTNLAQQSEPLAQRQAAAVQLFSRAASHRNPWFPIGTVGAMLIACATLAMPANAKVPLGRHSKGSHTGGARFNFD